MFLHQRLKGCSCYDGLNNADHGLAHANGVEIGISLQQVLLGSSAGRGRVMAAWKRDRGGGGFTLTREVKVGYNCCAAEIITRHNIGMCILDVFIDFKHMEESVVSSWK